MKTTRALLLICGFVLGASATQAQENCEPNPYAIIPCPGYSGGGSGSWVFFGPSGDGLYQAPGDPHPEAPGLWLGDNVAPGTCFADRGASITDADRDWLDDHCEVELARAFAPTWEMSLSDGCPNGEPHWAAKYFPAPQVVRIAYMPAYYDDCGGGSIGDHRGDSEMVMVQVVFNSTSRHWEFERMWLSSHFNSMFDRSSWAVREQAEFLYRPLTHPHVYVSERKHANYRSFGDCNYVWGIDSCNVNNWQRWRFPVDPARNIGSFHTDLIGCPPSRGVFAGSGTIECFYSQPFGASYPFCGWHSDRSVGNCATPYRSILMSPQYDRYGTSDWGPGPASP